MSYIKFSDCTAGKANVQRVHNLSDENMSISKNQPVSMNYSSQDQNHMHGIRLKNLLKTIKVYITVTGAGELAPFCRQFATMLGSGMPIMQCLEVLQMQTANTRLVEAIRGVINLLSSGWSLSRACSQYPSVFPPVYNSMVEAGEISGSLDRVMDRLALHFEKEYELKEKVKTAMIYPAVVAATSFAAVVGMIFFVIPQFAGVLESYGAGLPGSTAFIINLAGFVRERWIPLLFATVTSLTAIRFACSSPRGRVAWDRVKLRLPVTGPLTRHIIIARFARTLGTMLLSGVPLMHALNVAKKVTCNTEFETVIAWASLRAETGRDIAGAIEYSAVFPPMVSQMIAVGEKSGSLGMMLERLADYYEREVENMVNRLTALLEPMLILGMGFVVGFLVISTILPVFGVLGTIN